MDAIQKTCKVPIGVDHSEIFELCSGNSPAISNDQHLVGNGDESVGNERSNTFSTNNIFRIRYVIREVRRHLGLNCLVSPRSDDELDTDCLYSFDE